MGTSLATDGYIGSATRAVVKQFQSLHGLDDDGQAGNDTKQELYIVAQQSSCF
jgi:peptidoglycan hydrolase-like protein with peptidoglycan-binding domain